MEKNKLLRDYQKHTKVVGKYLTKAASGTSYPKKLHKDSRYAMHINDYIPIAQYLAERLPECRCNFTCKAHVACDEYQTMRYSIRKSIEGRKIAQDQHLHFLNILEGVERTFEEAEIQLVRESNKNSTGAKNQEQLCGTNYS
ncbi:hypothetical protein PG984_012824 [Apiospora sp. TS-2023a]